MSPSSSVSRSPSASPSPSASQSPSSSNSPSPSPSSGGAPSISSLTGTPTHGSDFTINGSNFGSHADYGGSEDFIAKAWNDFTVALNDGNWADDGLIQNVNNLILSTSSPLGGACTQFYRKRNINNSGSERQGSITVQTANNTGCFYVSFWYRESGGGTLAHGDGTKFFRFYYGTQPRDFYFGPYFENTTENSDAWGHVGRYSGTSAFTGMTSSDGNSFPGDEWLFIEVLVFLRGGTAIFGSDDYIEAWMTRIGQGRERLFRRGSGLASNAVPDEGTGANENQQWVTADLGNTDADGHTCGDLGSLFGAAPPGSGSGGHMDFHDAYESYTPARVYLSDTNSLATATRLHMQIPKSWNGTTISVQANRGSFSAFSGNYLIVVDENNVASAGFQIP